MLLSYLKEQVMLDSGHFILSSMDDVLIDSTMFLSLVKRELNVYQKHRPFIRNITLQINQNESVFPESFQPEFVTSVVPVGVPSAMAILMSNSTPMESAISDPRPFLWKYTKPVLHTLEMGKMDITGAFNYEIEEVLKDDGQGGQIVTDHSITDLPDDADSLIRLVVGRFLMSVGRSRRMFTITDLPIEMDVESMIDEGRTMYDEAKETLEDRNKWWEALGV